ncbi:transporter [Enterococcus sp. JM4C]|uniref:AEC family transporter n=1 Tax=Candidatus Enterococcus huntleyi TaxID=1857217 RepID=UPI00137A6C7F|nr:AEC family transporter [Enterococcus sp. JM4C]KAF1295827.1 transporter [Enterococcus sp. JM4C]
MVDAYLNIFVIFVLMFMGYWLSARQLFTNHTADVFSKLVLTIALPCNMFLNITKNFSRDEFLALFSGMLIPLCSIVATFIISSLYAKFTGVSATRRGTFITMSTFSNTIFMGLPINLAIFGEVSVPFVLLYYIINTSLFWTVGVYKMAQDNPESQQTKIKINPLAALKKVFSPALIGFIIGIIWVLLSIPVPKFLTSFTGYLGDLTTPLSMFAIGIIVFQIGIKNLRMNRAIMGVLIGRYLISPAIVWLLGQWIHVPEMMLQVFIIQSAMPIQNSVPILTRSYGGDVEFAASSLGYSVLLYLLYIPFLLHLIL